MIHVAIVIVNWNGRDETLECLGSLKKLIHQNCQISNVVVDNGSTDNSVDVIYKKFPDVHVEKIERNLGFTGGNNIGIQYALDHGADFVWLLNNDTVVEKNALTPLVGALRNSDVGVVGSKIYFMPGREFHKERYRKSDLGNVLWFAGGSIDWDNMYASHRGVDEVDHGQYNETQKTEFLTGCSMMIRKNVFQRIGMLDDRYYLYLEDVDFCLRAKRVGFDLLYVPASRVWHKNAGSSDGAGSPLHEYYLTRNRLLVGLRYAPLRTKAALIREAIRFLWESPLKRKAVIDALVGHVGKQYEPKKHPH